MRIGRRRFVLLAGAAVSAAAPTGRAGNSDDTEKMYGLISKLNAAPGQRDALTTILLEGTTDMPGCLSYVVAKDAADADSIWITEVWDKQESHTASLSLASVKEAISRGKPLIAGIAQRVVTQPIGGHGLALAGSR